MKRINSNEVVELLDISKINARQYGDAIAYVIGGKCKTAVNGQPFYILYLKDCNGEIITGFKFNVSEYIKEGISLSKIKNKFIQIHYYDNCAEGYSRSLILDNVYLIEDQSSIDVDSFIGATPGNKQVCDEILGIFSEIFHANITLSSIKMLTRHYEYCEGKSGGVIYHHYLALRTILSYKDILTDEEFVNLAFSYMMFMVIHLEYLTVNEDFDAVTISNLLSYSNNLEKQFHVNSRTEEIIYYFSGVEPKDYFVRTVTSTFECVKKSLAELHINRITPITQSGDAGYGIVKRYF